MYYNSELVELIKVILSSGLVSIQATTTLSPEKEKNLVKILTYRMNSQTSGTGSKGFNIYNLLIECRLDRLKYEVIPENDMTTLKWTVTDSETFHERVTVLLSKLEDIKDIFKIDKITMLGSIVIWFSFKVKEALQKLRSIIESGDLQICLTIIFTHFSDSSEELKVQIKAYATDLKWAEDYCHEKGPPLIILCII